MKLHDLRDNWEGFAQADPFWAVLTDPTKRNNKWSVEDLLSHGQAEISGVMAALERSGIVVARASALDFGCGVGRLTQALAAHFDKVTGVDIAPSMLTKASEINRKGAACEFVLNQATDLTALGERRFDFAYSSIVLQHIEPTIALSYIRELVRVLRPQGVAVFQVPEPVRHQRLKTMVPEPLLRMIRRLRGQTGPAMQMWGITRPIVEAAVVEAGGEVLAANRSYEGGAGYPGWKYVVRRTTPDR